MSTEMQTKVQSSPAQSFTPAQTGLLQRKCTLCNTPVLVEDSKRDGEELTLQRSSFDLAGTTTVPHFEHDFSKVRVYSTSLGMIQTKLKINEPGDIYEQEADRVAEQVMHMEEPRVQRQPEEELVQTKPVITPLIKSQSEGEEKGEEEFLQTRELPGQSAEVMPALSSSIQNLKGDGQALPESTRAFFEPRFGHDFSNVRVHTGVNASKIAESVYARAFTLGNNIVFGHGQYSTGTDKGRRLLGHELTHVIQQDKSGFISGYSRGSISEVSKMRTESIQRSIVPHPEIRGDFIIGVNPDIDREERFIEQVSSELASEVQGARVPRLMGIGRFRDLLRICWNRLSLIPPGERRITVRLVGWGGVVSHFILITPQVEIPEESGGQSESMLPALEESEPIEEIGCPSLESRRIHPPADRNEALWIAHCLNEWHPSWLSTLPACPCSVTGARDSDRFNEDDPLTSMVVECFHPGATYFFRSNPVRLNYEGREFIHGQQCTYDSDEWLITGGAAAGTPDFYNPDEHYDYHQNIDVVPFNQLGWMDYINYWRPNNSTGCIENHVTGTIPLLCRPILD